MTIISVITDIMQHYHNVIVTAKKEVLIATNAWEAGKSVKLVTSAFQELNERAGKEGRKARLATIELMSGRCKDINGCRHYSQCISAALR